MGTHTDSGGCSEECLFEFWCINQPNNSQMIKNNLNVQHKQGRALLSC